MTAMMRFGWVRDIALPLGLLLIPLALALAVTGEWLVLAAPIAFAIGFLRRPARVWPLWTAMVLALWALNGIIALFDLVEETAGAGEETVWGFMFESALVMAVLVSLPAWLGRAIGRVMRRGPHGPRHEPAA